MKDFFLNTLFPKFCFGCRAETTYLCQDCRGLLDILEHSYCLCEKSPIKLFPGGAKCQKCRDKKIAGLYFALPYDSPVIKKMIYQFKYQPHVKDLAATLASLIIEHLIKIKKNTDDVFENAVLMPIPLDTKKLRMRGYNQSELLAEELAKIINIPVAKDVLIKVKPTKPQMELSKEERQENLRGAFALKNTGSMRDKKIFLVDDVYTTGSTIQTCATILKDAGVKQVFAMTIAREAFT